MEGDLIKINRWLLPLSWIYGSVVSLRNELFELGILKSKSYKVPIISVGNITVGGTGKTPHTEYLINFLQKKYQVAVLSRGYKRKSNGFVLATADTTMEQIGDEPYQMKQKFPNTYIAVDKNRCRGIDLLCDNSKVNPEPDVILLDDAFQHRYVNSGMNILLVDYHRLICYDKLLPAGRLRESPKGKNRANIVIVTKCPADIKPMGIRVISKALNLYPYQKLFFSTFRYGKLTPVFGGDTRTLESLQADEQVLLLAGIASPEQMKVDIEKYTGHITSLFYDDHHYFSEKDIKEINDTFEEIKDKRMIITTEKDASRLISLQGLSDEVRQHLYALPIEVNFIQNQEKTFNENILGYVQKNTRNSILAKSKNANKSDNSHHLRNRTR